jgi:ribosome-binding protein aMBF1 (putative translation factor)
VNGPSDFYQRVSATQRRKRREMQAAASKEVTCHFCGLTRKPKGNFVCPQCHTVYNPERNPAIGFGGEIKVARKRLGWNQQELCDHLKICRNTLMGYESGDTLAFKNPKAKIIRERLRIWVESTKSPFLRRKEIDNMFNFDQKETENGRENAQ